MPLTAADRLILVRVKIERAKKHFDEFKLDAERFREAYTHVIGTKEDPQTGQAEQYFAKLPVATFNMLATAGDVIQNLRSALDHLAYQLATVGNPGVEPEDTVVFPICASAKIYESAKVRKVKGMRSEAVEAIDALKPYKGGNNALWRLHELNNIDKHRFVVTLGEDYLLQGQGFDGQYWRKANRILFRGIFGPEVNYDVNTSGTETVSQPQVFEGGSLLKFLDDILKFVDYVVGRFEPFLA